MILTVMLALRIEYTIWDNYSMIRKRTIKLLLSNVMLQHGYINPAVCHGNVSRLDTMRRIRKHTGRYDYERHLRESYRITICDLV